MKVHETRSHARASAEELAESKVGKGKQKTGHDGRDGEQQPHTPKNKKAKVEGDGRGDRNGKSTSEISAEFEEFCKATRQHLSVEQMRRILEANEQDPSGADDAVVQRCQDMMFYGPLERCKICGGQLDCTGSNYECRGAFSEWSTCTYTTVDAPRKDQLIKVPDGIGDDGIIKEWVKRQESRRYPHRELLLKDKPLAGFMISLSGRLSRRHQTWREEIENNGGKISNNVNGISCLVVSPAERERGGSSRVAEAMERNIPVVSENWLIDSIEKKQPQPLDAYDVLSDLAPDGRGIPWDKMDPSEEAIESMSAELKIYGKRGVHKDSRLQEQGGSIFERDGIIYNCAFSLCDQGLRGTNEICVMQLIQVPEKNVHLYYKKGRVVDDGKGEERVEEFNNVDDAVKEFVRLFEDITGNDFESWERKKKFQKKTLKFYPIDMDDGIEVRHGGLGIRQLGAAAAHCKLEPLVANFMKVLCSQEIYKYATMEMGYDSPDMPLGMLTDQHLKICEEQLVNFLVELEKESGEKANLLWLDFSNKWFTLMHSTRPFVIRNFRELADHVAAGFESIRDINVASRLIGDMSGATIDDPLSDRYNKLGCSISPLDKESDDYKMIVKYLETTYEPVKVGDVIYGASVENIFAVESSAGPSYEEVKKSPNKILLWCGTRSCNMLRHLHKGLLPAVCRIPVPGYMFGRAIVCSDTSAEAARYGFTAVDRPEGFLFLAVVAQGEQITEMSTAPNDTKELEEKKVSVRGLGRKKTEESEHFNWKDDVKVPCGRLIPSEHKDSPMEYNEYAVYDPKQVCMRFVVAVKYDEQNMEMDAAEGS
ncbi:hypothetical protein Cni_G24290 [Canna indica]|uniref:Poly [ADP-ribose] polymerase n=1 Tax=Canna indica TaxID=4628 RepID=A0AAQ3QLB8_9LILI|nr:hypothetical protein Cni_G24290 [Canna indica]